MLKREIPTIKFPNISEYTILNKDEELVSLSKSGLICDSQYYKQGIPGSYKDCYARKSVAELLIKAEQSLPDGYRLKIYDAYRPICIQQRLWNYYRNKVRLDNKLLSDAEVDAKTAFFVSKPSYNEMKPSLHNTGGAVDLTLIGPNGKELNMGTGFDDFTNKSWTNHYEEYTQNDEIRDNRRLLYWTMINAGFTNLPSEWWHYDYGTKFWAYFNNTDALYKGELDLGLNDRFPLL